MYSLDCLFFFRLEIPFLGRFGPKIHNYCLSWNFVPRLIKKFKIPWWCSLVLLSIGDTFLGKFGPKNQNVSLSWNFALDYFKYAELCRKYVVFTFPILDQKKTYSGKSDQKIKIVILSGSLVPRPIWICGIQWWCSLFQFLTEDTFLGKLGTKNENCFFKVKFDTNTNLNMPNSMVMSILSVLDWK